MKKLFTIVAFALGLSNSLHAQIDDPSTMNLDVNEDTADVTTLKDLIDEKSKVYSRTNEKGHYNEVWKYSKTFDFVYVNTTMTPQFDGKTGRGVALAPEYKSDWGIMFSRTKSYGLHKPIANMVKFSFDWRGFQLNVNHFKAELNADKKAYDSSVEYVQNDNGSSNSKFPWNMEKYEVSYTMGVGPSVSVAPFVPLHKRALDFIQLNMYFHVNYSASAIYSMNNDKYDASTPADDDYDLNNKKIAMDKATKLEWGHGLGTSFGVSLSWKFIGVGFETNSVTRTYKPIGSEFESEKSKFKFKQSNLFLRINF